LRRHKEGWLRELVFGGVIRFMLGHAAHLF
jgi:hypothetical protein